jgi:chromosome segregation ATPase
MNATISLNNGAAHVHTAPSKAEQARRLELFEIALREERIAELEDRIDFYEEQMATDREESHYQIGQLRKQISTLQLECQKLTDFNAELQAAGNQLADERETLQAEVERLSVQAVARDRITEKALSAQRSAEAELKRLKQLDPDSMKKRLDKHKRKAAELADANAELRAKNHALVKENRKLHMALDKACADINAAQKLEPIRVTEPPRIGRWELYSCEQEGAYQLLDLENETSRTVRVGKDGELTVPKLRPVPKAIASWVVEVHNEYFGGQING